MSWQYEADPAAPGTAKATTTFNFGAAEIEYVMFGLRGFNNFIDAKGRPIEFKTTPKVVNGQTYHVLSENILKVIPEAAIKELAAKIKELNSIRDEDVKN